MQPKIKRIREKYAGNQQKMNEAMNELYAKEGYSSMTGGCSGMLIQFPIMMGVYFVNYKILSYVLNIKDTALEAVKSAVRLLPEYAKLAETSEKNAEYRIELLAIEHFDDTILLQSSIHESLKSNQILYHIQLKHNVLNRYHLFQDQFPWLLYWNKFYQIEIGF
jgi:hypothetical protein